MAAATLEDAEFNQPAKETALVAAPPRPSKSWTWLWLVLGLLGALLLFWLLSSFLKPKNENGNDSENVVDISYQVKKNHPWVNTGDPIGFTINGVEGATLNLKRGVPYLFRYSGPPGAHPFCLTASSMGGAADERLPLSPAPFDNGQKTIVFDASWPSTFYYQSSTDRSAGGQIHLV